MKYPPLDEYRLPFVEPLGHLVIQAARADNELIDLCAMNQGTDELSLAEIGAKFRQWDKKAQSFAQARLSGIELLDYRQNALAALQQFNNLRDLRHRAIHDAIEVGAFNVSGGWRGEAVSVTFEKPKQGSPTLRISRVSKDALQLLAMRYYDVSQTFMETKFALRVSRE